MQIETEYKIGDVLYTFLSDKIKISVVQILVEGIDIRVTEKGVIQVPMYKKYKTIKGKEWMNVSNVRGCEDLLYPCNNTYRTIEELTNSIINGNTGQVPYIG